MGRRSVVVAFFRKPASGCEPVAEVGRRHFTLTAKGTGERGGEVGPGVGGRHSRQVYRHGYLPIVGGGGVGTIRPLRLPNLSLSGNVSGARSVG